MPRKIEKNAKSKEEALRLAAKEFGVPVEELSYTVEREIGKGLIGKLLGKEVIISAWITKEAEREERLRKSRMERKKIRDQKVSEIVETKKAQKTAVAKEEVKEEVKAAVRAVAKAKAEAKPEIQAEVKPETQTEAKTETVDKKNREVTEKAVSDAQYFAENLIHKIGLEDAKVVAKNGGTAVDIDVSGEKMGLIIGKRGDTLDAIQYLTSLYVNKEKNSYIKINIDTEGYRAKREKTLRNLAASLERRVVKNGSKIVLEPMSPNERRIIHSALQDSGVVTTYSVGEEPRRSVIVAPKD